MKHNILTTKHQKARIFHDEYFFCSESQFVNCSLQQLVARDIFYCGRDVRHNK